MLIYLFVGYVNSGSHEPPHHELLGFRLFMVETAPSDAAETLYQVRDPSIIRLKAGFCQIKSFILQDTLRLFAMKNALTNDRNE